MVVCVRTSQNWRKLWILPYVNTELFNKVLADFAREFSLGADKRILWLWIAGWHTSKDIELPSAAFDILLPFT